VAPILSIPGLAAFVMASSRVAAALAALQAARNSALANAAEDADKPALPEGVLFERLFNRYTISRSVSLETSLKVVDTVKIVDCRDGVVELRGKPKIATIDKTTDSRVVFDGCVCGLEIVNCNNVTVVLGAFEPTVAVDKSTAVTITLTQSDVLPDQIVWCDSTDLKINSSDGDGPKILFCAVPAEAGPAATAGPLALPEPVPSLTLCRPEGVDPRKQLQTKLSVLKRIDPASDGDASSASRPAAATVVIGVGTRPFDLFDGVIAMAPPGFGER
jgi:Adenylate cyclase associated (CAP) C terminal